jgi:hypothetical protein
MIDFVKAMAPVLAANLLTVGFVYACWLASKTEGRDRSDFVAACGFACLTLALVLFGMWLYGK